MSQDPDEGGERSHEPTQKKLDDARKRGEVPKSVDLITAGGYAGFLLVMLAFGTETLMSLGGTLTALIDNADALSHYWLNGGGTVLTLALLTEIMVPLSIWFGVPALCALLVVIAQRALVFAPDRIQPKLNKISVLSNLKNKFGRSGLFEFFKSSVKLVIYSVILFMFLWSELPRIVAALELEPKLAISLMFEACLQFFLIVLVIAVSLGAFDMIFQFTEHTRKNMMSRKELTDEMKQSEGDPYVKQQRRQRAQEIALDSMLNDVAGADVVVVNPQHYAVALKWSRAPGSAPKCVAKGVDLVAQRIKERAADSGVPIHRDPPTARALFASIDIDMEIKPEHYQAVAAAIRFAEAMRAKVRRRTW